jgi:F0F1-type ATP synthase gamma subunit
MTAHAFSTNSAIHKAVITKELIEIISGAEAL